MKYIKGLDGLRGISILMVLFTHLSWDDYYFSNLSISKERITFLFNGFTGVNIFFVLSGFLITLILLNEKEQNQTISLKNFYIRRFLRLTPPLVVFFPIVAFLMYFEKIPQPDYSLTYAIFYVYNFCPNQYYSGELAHTWSLAVEEQFYILWSFVVKFFNHFKLISIAMLIVILCIFAKQYLPTVGNLNYDYKLERWFLPAVAPIIFGCLTAYFCFRNINYLNGTLSNVMALLFYLSPLILPFEFSIWFFFLQAIGICFLLQGIYFNQNSLMVKLLSFPVLIFIGKISYGLYVYQGLFLRTGAYHSDLWIQNYPQNIILTFVVSVISYFFFEKRILKLKSRFSMVK